MSIFPATITIVHQQQNLFLALIEKNDNLTIFEYRPESGCGEWRPFPEPESR
jgi:hypothetical protein